MLRKSNDLILKYLKRRISRPTFTSQRDFHLPGICLHSKAPAVALASPEARRALLAFFASSSLLVECKGYGGTSIMYVVHNPLVKIQDKTLTKP